MLSLAWKTVPLGIAAGLTLVADITLGSLFVAAGLVVSATVAYFTIRNLQRSYWRNLVDERDAEILEMKRVEEEKMQERAQFAEEQRDLRHRLKNELAERQKQLELERAKSDLTKVFARIDVLEGTLKAHEPTFDQLVVATQEQAEVLRQILATLRSRPT